MNFVLIFFLFVTSNVFAVNMQTPKPSVNSKSSYYVNTNEQYELNRNIEKILKNYSGISIGKAYSNEYKDYFVEDSYSFALIYGKQITRNWSIETPFRYIKRDLIDKNTLEKSKTETWTSQVLLAYYLKFGNFGIGFKTGVDFTIDDLLNEGFNGIGIIEVGYGSKEGLDYGISFETNYQQKDTKYLILLNFYFR